MNAIGRFTSSLCAALFSLCILLSSPLAARVHEVSIGSVNITREVRGLNGAWGFGFLPDGSMIITEKRGRLFLYKEGERMRRISGLPEIKVQGQGGLLDVAPARDFETSSEIFLTFAGALEEGIGTSVAVAKLNTNSLMLEDLRVIYKMTKGARGGTHFGSRVVEAPDGTLFVSIGDRGDRPSAQDLSRSNGSIIRINRDGSIPEDNPFLDQDAPEIWSYGHRNPQGMDISNSGDLWAVEHGPKGGDELNLIVQGQNYGWPVISYGTHYSGATVGEGTSKLGMVQPEHFWDPSMAPSGLMIYEGDMFPEWRGDIFIGSLKFDYISRLSGDQKTEVEQIKTMDTLRVRDVREGPDGSIWFISEDRSAIYKISR